jgi:hypothetical protein
VLATEENTLLAFDPTKRTIANHDHENDSQHHGIFRDVLSFLIVP